MAATLKVIVALWRAFSLLKGRFRRLKYLDMLRIQDIPTVIFATCTLHNVWLDSGDQWEDFKGDIEEEVNGFENLKIKKSTIWWWLKIFLTLDFLSGLPVIGIYIYWGPVII